MNTEGLIKEVKESKLLSIYNKFARTFQKHRNWYIPLLCVVFVPGFIYSILDKVVPSLFVWILLICWAPGLVAFFCFGVIHFLTGFKLRSLSKKYNIPYNEDFLKVVHENVKN
jgi:hypothetical protein